MKTIVALSRLRKIKELNNGMTKYSFHFKGVYNGHVIKSIELESVKKFNLMMNEDYLLYLGLIGVSGSVINVRMIKFKCLEEFYWK